MRVGMGYDVHPLVDGRDLVIGGVEIPFEKGLSGHSDADVLLHAICDALLGASGLGDMGEHFPDTDPRFKDISSRTLLSRVWDKLRNAGFRVVNVDAVVAAQAPRLSPFRERMVALVGKILEMEPARVNIKYTTTEKLGFIGRGEGISALCVVLLEETVD
ncbi:MAG: 2-C-methyl-D-erythritol 2,4-cyclodiphosphate synthase [Deltaproteobacteria bacterium]|nr:2-C-methyl-D-erythritol 2,4-cyclodiphosphate synthase [Deltaproteobacteria bacterium]MBW1955921.1 2-C-methyl-D-erythritol 2,4-cyclodiphosphate synthase [Deltaproteobacteria bacterium]MBW2041306.1 2-C-methyl-D-erythritol 2,4-cyclodiphosphate synthase [Deltaproteobacteria bacterium]MBW2131780.1 2-C-methyl-D-erythritol 2,4-cyclodiphosphate synthase [Deltaproteobacteria bacterium]